MKRPLKVGFDLDGVILYNPVRVLRPLSAFISKLIFKKKATTFFIPKSPFAKFIWYLLHKSSFIPARGLNDLRKLVQEGRIEAHLVTGRYASLSRDFRSWMKSIDSDRLFASQSHNAKNEQPHIFKQNMIKKLGLDVFVEDNWDIVKEFKILPTRGRAFGSEAQARRDSDNEAVGKMSKFKVEAHPKIFWITNFLDRHIAHEHKFQNLRDVIKRLGELTK